MKCPGVDFFEQITSVNRRLLSGPWSAFREWFPGNAGYGKLRIENSTHVYWEQIEAYDGSVTDSIWIKQEHHGPFKPLDPWLQQETEGNSTKYRTLNLTQNFADTLLYEESFNMKFNSAPP